jgi:c(7)-type cytochrome triheme protein
MLMCSIHKRKRNNERGLYLLVLACAVFVLVNTSSAQIYLPGPPPQNPADYGKVILDTYSSTSPGGVVFDHWLHRSKFTCRLCHVDIGFAMEAKATGIRAGTNRQGFHCGACHDGKRIIDGKTIFASCSDEKSDKRCARCHSLGKRGVREYEYNAYTKKFPKMSYGIDWMATESAGIIKPIDFLEGVSVKERQMMTRQDLSIVAAYPWVHPITFSHEKHSIWGGCELCHPEIFPAAAKGTVTYSMFSNIDGRYCGACHGKVAFPLNYCSRCHPPRPALGSTIAAHGHQEFHSPALLVA